MATEKREIEIALRSKSAEASADKLTGKVKGVGTAADGSERSMFKLSKAAAAVGSALATAAISKFFIDATKAATAFNASMSNLSAITGATGKDLDFLRKTALEFGATTTLSATQAAEALKLVASAKPDLLSNAAALKEVTRQAVLLAEASGGTLQLADAAGVVGKALNQFGADADQAARFVNVLAAGSKFGSSEVLATSEALKAAGVAAASAKVSFEETNAAIQVLAKNGISGAEAGTALRNIFLKLDTDTNSKLRPSVVGFSQALKNLNDLNEDGAAQVKRFGLENIIAGKSLLSSVSTLGDLTTKLTGTNTAFDQASTNVDNLGGDVKALGSAFESLQIQVGSLADGDLRKLTQSTTQFLQALTGNEDALKEWGGALDNIESAALSLAIVLSGKLASLMVSATSSVIAQIAANNKLLVSEAASLKSKQTLAAQQAAFAIQTKNQAMLALQVAANETRRGIAITNLARANSAAIATQSALTAATNAYTVAAGRASIAARGLTGAVALLGGPVGIALIAAASIAYFVTQADKAETSADKYAAKVRGLTGDLDGLEQSQNKANIRLRENLKISIASEIEKATKALKEQEALVVDIASSQNPMGFETARLKSEEMRAELEKLKQSLFELESQTSKGNILGDDFISEKAKQDVADLFSGSSGADLFGGGGGESQDPKGAGKESPDTPKSSGSTFIDRLRLETEQLQMHLELRKAIESGFITEAEALEVERFANESMRYQEKFDYEILKLGEDEEAKEALREQYRMLQLERVLEFEQLITEAHQKGEDERVASTEKGEQLVRAARQGTVDASLGLLSVFASKSKAAAIAMLAIQKAQAISTTIASALAGSIAVYAQLPYPVAIGASAKILAQGKITAGLIAATGLAQGAGILSGGGSVSSSSSIGGDASYNTGAQPSQPESKQPTRVINITGLEGYGDDQPIPLTVGGLRDLLSSNEDVNIAINEGQQGARRIGAI